MTVYTMYMYLVDCIYATICCGRYEWLHTDQQ